MRFELPLELVRYELLLDLQTPSKGALTLRLLRHVRLSAPLGLVVACRPRVLAEITVMMAHRLVDVVWVVALSEEFADRCGALS